MTRRTSWWRSRSNAPSRDTVWPGSWIGWRAPARPAAGHPHRQRQGVLWQGDARVGTCPWRRLRLIEPGKPNQNAYVESLNGRLRDECLNEHWFKIRSEEHTSELQSLMRIPYAVFCLKKKKQPYKNMSYTEISDKHVSYHTLT